MLRHPRPLQKQLLACLFQLLVRRFKNFLSQGAAFHGGKAHFIGTTTALKMVCEIKRAGVQQHSQDAQPGSSR